MNYTQMLAEFGLGSAHPGGFAKSVDMLMHMDMNEQTAVLDCGCGTGQTSAYLKQLFNCRTFALEYHPLMFQKAKQRFIDANVDVHLMEGSIEAIPLPSQSMDYVIVESVLSFVPLTSALQEINRVLKPGGSILLNELVTIAPLSVEQENELKKHYGFCAVFSNEAWQHKLKKHGFSSIHVLELEKASTLQQDEGDKGSDMIPSPFISQESVEVMSIHAQLMEQWNEQIGHIVLKAKKIEAPKK